MQLVVGLGTIGVVGVERQDVLWRSLNMVSQACIERGYTYFVGYGGMRRVIDGGLLYSSRLKLRGEDTLGLTSEE